VRPPRRSHSLASDDERYLLESGYFDAAAYRQHAHLSGNEDAANHYLAHGWRLGAEPNASFDSAFLEPYYATVGFEGPPVLHWLDLSAAGFRPPTMRAEAEHLAASVRNSEFFDAVHYSAQLPPHMDPAVHYAVVGECVGWTPSERFDPDFYRARYSDIADSGEPPLAHFEKYGRHEGRRPLPAAARLMYSPVPRQGPTVLVVLHDASRTGAPLLGWNLVRYLSQSYEVVSVLLHRGVLEEDFAAVSAVVVGPLTWDEWHPAEMSRLAERIVAHYSPRYAVCTSVEASLFLSALAIRGVPSVALVNELAAYISPITKMRDVFEWAPHVLFPARFVARAAYAAFPGLHNRRGLHVMAPGRVALPVQRQLSAVEESVAAGEDIRTIVRPSCAADAFVVLGVGAVQIRKGVDLFLAAASAARRLAPDIQFRFVWIGDGYDPVKDVGYSAYLREQIQRSELVDLVVITPAVDDLEPAYCNADVLFMCSRLDPQPNVGIDALLLGIPTVCFAEASGTAETLAADNETQSLVVPHLDAHAAALEICKLARDHELFKQLQDAVHRVGRGAHDMERYFRQVDNLGRQAAFAVDAADLAVLVESNVVDLELALPPDSVPPGVHGAEVHVLLQWSVVGTSSGFASRHFRRPCAGFHPQAYAAAHSLAYAGAQNPTAHWLRSGRPDGPWSHPVYSPRDFAEPADPPRIALHAHMYAPEYAPELAARLAQNSVVCDLFVSTDSEEKANRLREELGHHHGEVNVRVFPNRGRDIGPFLTGLRSEVMSGKYDVFGHVHAKQSIAVDAAIGTEWRDFLWDNLLGGDYPIVELAASAFASDPELGLVWAEDPHLVGWDANRKIAVELARRMRISESLPDFFDFPLGTMFWCRPSALRRLFELQLDWEDYPPEPVAYDGTILHAIERLLPFVAYSDGFKGAAIRVPGTTW
jgi:glycosyltransferase involved in cell wall biosynthesis